MKTFQAIHRSEKNKKSAESKTYRFLSFAECRELRGRVPVVDKNGHITEVSITSVKTWKRKADIEIGWKWGMYEFGKCCLVPGREQDMFVAEVVAEEQVEALSGK